MLVGTFKDRNKWAPEGSVTLYAVLAEYKGKLLIKIGHTRNYSFLGRLAWNEHANDGYHKFGMTRSMNLEEKDRVKISQVVDLKEIVDEVRIKETKENVKGIEESMRKKFTSFNFNENFSGKTEFVVVGKNTIEDIKNYFDNIRNTFKCS